MSVCILLTDDSEARRRGDSIAIMVTGTVKHKRAEIVRFNLFGEVTRRQLAEQLVLLLSSKSY
jgi:predicted nucleic acid-binding protein